MRMSLNNNGASIAELAVLCQDDDNFDVATQHLDTIDAIPDRGKPALARSLLAPLQRRFEIIAQTNPAARAVACNGRILTYGELDTQADELALQLQRDGLPPGSCCLLRLEPSLAFARAILATLKAGAICLQIDPALPHERCAAVIELLKPALLFVHERDTVGWGDDAMRTVRCGEDPAPLPYGWPDESPVVDDTPAHVFATLSADGDLRTRICTHKALGASLDAVADARLLEAADPATFWRSLSTGALLTIIPPA
jgi:non-ribosomal peptide synthetase component F